MFLLYDTLGSILLSDAEEGGYKIYLIYFIAKHQCLPGIGAFQSLHSQPAYTTMLFTSEPKVSRGCINNKHINPTGRLQTWAELGDSTSLAHIVTSLARSFATAGPPSFLRL